MSNNTAVATEVVKRVSNKPKIFTKGHYMATLLAFVGYILVSILIRNEFDLQSAYQISIEYSPGVGILAALGLNFAVIPLLLSAYFYQKDNGKQNKILVSLYFVFLIACFMDSFAPHIKEKSLSGENLLYAILYPTVFLITHRALSLLLYVILRGKETDSDYRIYLGLVLLAPVMFIFLIIAVVFWLFQASSQNNYNEYQYSSPQQSVDLKEEVRRQLNVGLRTVGVYYDDGWKAVDYWNHGFSLSEVVGEDFRNTYLQAPDGKIYILSTNIPNKESIYYFS